MPELSRDSHPAQPIDITMLSAVIAMPALSESEHGDCFKEAPDTPIGNVARMVLAPPIGDQRMAVVTWGGRAFVCDDVDSAEHAFAQVFRDIEG